MRGRAGFPPTCRYVCRIWMRGGGAGQAEAEIDCGRHTPPLHSFLNLLGYKILIICCQGHAMKRLLILFRPTYHSLNHVPTPFPTTTEVIEATIQAVREGHTRYTAVTGEAALRAAICKDLKTRKGVKYAPEEIIVGNGAKQEVYQAVLALCRPGDEVIIPAPYWPSYPEIVKLAGATPVILETKAADGFLVDPEALSAAITPKTRMVREGGREREREEERGRSACCKSILSVYPFWNENSNGEPLYEVYQ